ncbi:YjiH family protein [Photobacterium salinisoli]|uniref:YjiH family protein n=1 Tax=Photobacterium salinisoli TaxID=1616783 RepID=UPI001F0965C1|nr:YjiH family protein [Photobacterium salinisoli]
MSTQTQIQTQPNTAGFMDYAKFILPSLLGILLFLVPMQFDGEPTVLIAWFAGLLQNALGDAPLFAMILINLFAVLSVLGQLGAPPTLLRTELYRELFSAGMFWTLVRCVGAVFATMVYFQWGPELLWNENTGGLMLNNLVSLLLVIFLLAAIFLPLLLMFGLLEFVGALFTRLFRPLFKLPGRSAVDCMTSWVGDATIGVVLTNLQYENGHYTKREAAVIATTFSLVSVTFSIVVITYLNLAHMIGPFFLTLLVAGLTLAVIMPRIPPLSRIGDEYYEGAPTIDNEEIPPKGKSVWSYGLERALAQSQMVTGPGVILRQSVRNVLEMWVGIMPVVMAFGTLAILLAEYTPLFRYLGLPFQPILSLLQVPEAAAAAPAMVVGFADMFLPAVLGSGIENEMTRFIIACISVTQLIFMSEVGTVILRSKIPLNFLNLVAIFLLRTLISLPIVVGIAHLLF